MKVILKETMDNLGLVGSEVTVKDGYARNYLLPQGKALISNEKNKKVFAQSKAKIELKIAKEKSLAEEMAERVKQIVCSVSAKVKEENSIFGSVGIKDIADALEKTNVKIDKRQILLTEPIKTIGEFKIPIRLYKDIEPEFLLKVVPE